MLKYLLPLNVCISLPDAASTLVSGSHSLGIIKHMGTIKTYSRWLKVCGFLILEHLIQTLVYNSSVKKLSTSIWCLTGLTFIHRRGSKGRKTDDVQWGLTCCWCSKSSRKYWLCWGSGSKPFTPNLIHCYIMVPALA